MTDMSQPARAWLSVPERVLLRSAYRKKRYGFVLQLSLMPAALPGDPPPARLAGFENPRLSMRHMAVPLVDGAPILRGSTLYASCTTVLFQAIEAHLRRLLLAIDPDNEAVAGARALTTAHELTRLSETIVAMNLLPVCRPTIDGLTAHRLIGLARAGILNAD